MMRCACLLALFGLASCAAKALLFHKPAGLVTTHHDELGRRTVYDALRERLPAEEAGEDWHACGRLDAETSGLLLFTTDGRLVRHVTDPTAGAGLLKTYRCKCHRIDEAAIERLRSGVDLSGGLGVSRPASGGLEAESSGGGKQSMLTIGIREGKNRMIRRMLHAVGSGVMRLERLAIGGIELGSLPEGEYRWLSAEEVRDGLGYPDPLSASALGSDEGYELLDSGGYERLELFGGRIVARPCPSATWRRGAPASLWAQATLRYVDAPKGGEREGEWIGEVSSDAADDAAKDDSATADWQMDSGCGFALALQQGRSGQVGAFPEQRDNWHWLREACADACEDAAFHVGEAARPSELRVLNLFAHTGGSTLACAAAGGIEVVHLDGARSAIGRARMNADLSGLADAPVRWVSEDALTYCERALKRGERFDGLIVDPPAFGRGGKKKGVEWRISRDMPRLLELLEALLTDTPAFVLLTCHDARWPSATLAEEVERLLGSRGRAGHVEHGGMVLRAAKGGRDLPMGQFARWRSDERS